MPTPHVAWVSDSILNQGASISREEYSDQYQKLCAFTVTNGYLVGPSSYGRIAALKPLPMMNGSITLAKMTAEISIARKKTRCSERRHVNTSNSGRSGIP